jgi:hypothetical protein
MLERIVPHEEGLERLNEIARRLADGTIEIPSPEKFENGFRDNTPLADKLPEFTEEKVRKMNERYPDTF